MLRHHTNQNLVLEQVGFCAAWYEEPAEMKKYHSSCLPVCSLICIFLLFREQPPVAVIGGRLFKEYFLTILIVF